MNLEDGLRIPLMFRLFLSMIEVLRLDDFDCKSLLRTTYDDEV